jgi:hypothetical protein
MNAREFLLLRKKGKRKQIADPNVGKNVFEMVFGR